MAFRKTRLTRHVIAAVLLSLALGCGRAQSQSDVKPVSVAAASTNATPAPAADASPPGSGRLNHIEDELFGTHQPVDLQRTINDATAGPDRPLPRIVPLDPHEKERLDRQKDWAFSTMNDLDSQPSVEHILGVPEYGPDGQPRQKLSAVQEFWEDGGRDKATNSDTLMDVLGIEWDMKQISSTNGFNPLASALSGGDKTMKSILLLEELNGSAGNPGAGTAPADMAVTGGARAAATAAAADRDRQRRQDEFNSLLGGAPAAIAGPSLPFNGQNNNLPGPPQVYSPAESPAFSPVAVPVAVPASPSSLSPVMGAYNSFPAGYPSPAAGANPASMENLRNLLNPEPKTAATQPTDPFVQNFPKRRF